MKNVPYYMTIYDYTNDNIIDSKVREFTRNTKTGHTTKNQALFLAIIFREQRLFFGQKSLSSCGNLNQMKEKWDMFLIMQRTEWYLTTHWASQMSKLSDFYLHKWINELIGYIFFFHFPTWYYDFSEINKKTKCHQNLYILASSTQTSNNIPQLVVVLSIQYHTTVYHWILESYNSCLE